MNSIQNITTHRVATYQKTQQFSRAREVNQAMGRDTFVRSGEPGSFTDVLSAIKSAMESQQESRPERISTIKEQMNQGAYVVEISSLMRRMCE